MNTWRELKKFTNVIRLSNPFIVWIWIGYSVFHGILPFLSLYFSSQILNQLMDEHYTLAGTYALLMCTLVMVCSFIAKLFYNQLQVVRQNAAQGVDRALLKKTMVMAYETMEKQETLDTLRRTRVSMNGSGGIDSAIHFVAVSGEALCKIVCATLAFLVVMVQIKIVDIYFVILMIVLCVFLIFKNQFANQHGKLLEEMCHGNDRNNALSNYIMDLFYKMSTAKDIRLFQMDSLYCEKSKIFTDDPIYTTYVKKNGRLLFLNDLISQILALSAYVYVASLAIRSIISIGEVLFLSGIILNAVTSIAEFQSKIAQLRHQLSYLNAFHTFLHTPNMSYDGTLPIEKRDDGEYEIEFQGVSFQYPNSETEILHDINLKFHLKEKLAIVGVNGAGKTTIVKLLCRLYEPTKGTILLNGIDIKKYEYAQYTSIFSVVFQDFKLFSYELDENIAGGTKIDQSEVFHILQRLDMKQYVKALRDQEHTLLYKDNGDGVSVSGGEAQKLAIARALYKDATFVILDEPTAALDPISEAEIYENFNLLVNDKTTLYISHRMSSCRFCDRIVVMEQGCIVETGTHEELLNQNHQYAQLWRAQAEYYV